jgi:D-alanyl-D-alanine carboxypeptidase
MKKIINISSFIIILISCASLYFLVPRIMQKSDAADEKTKKMQQETPVTVAETQKDLPKKVAPSGNSLLTSKIELPDVPDAPVKKEGVKDPYMRAKSAIVIDADTGTILFYQNGKNRMAIASLTKMMTAILSAEKIKNLEKEVVTIDKEALSMEGTVVGCPRTGYCISNRLRLGEQLRAIDLLHAMLMNSTNDAAMALGKHIGGSKQSFADLMNEKAKDIGLSDTNFCNPSGLDEDDKPGQCYSSAYDLARIAAYSLKYDVIWDTMRTKDLDISSVDGALTHHIINTDVLLDQMPNCLGGKTGFTYEAGKSLMMAAHHPNNKSQKIVAVLLDDAYRWEDMRNLIEWTFESYDWPDKSKR